MNDIYINSSNIKVFPTSRRSDINDRQARLFTEKNFVGIVNRLTDLDSFVINGLELSYSNDNFIVSKGSCNIHGYYFELLNDIAVDCTYDNTSADENYIYLKISVNTFSGFEVLSSQDETDLTLDSTTEFKGLSIIQSDSNPPAQGSTQVQGSYPSYYYLLLGKLTSANTVSKNTNDNLKFDLSSLQVKVNENDGIKSNNGLTPDTVSSIQNLYEFLNNTLIIDDGNIVGNT